MTHPVPLPDLLEAALGLTRSLASVIQQPELDLDRLQSAVEARENVMHALSDRRDDSTRSEPGVAQLWQQLREEDARLIELMASQKARVAEMLSHARRNLRSQSASAADGSGEVDRWA